GPRLVPRRRRLHLPYRQGMTTNETTTPMSFEQAMDTSVRPQDDLYRFINGTYIREHEIPADRARDGAFMVLRDLSEQRVPDIITDAAAADATGEAKQIGDLYASFMAEERIEALGTAPLQADLELFTAARDKDALARAMGTLAPTGVRGAVALFVDTDFNDPDRYSVFLWQSGLGLPDESYYREDAHADTRSAYVAHIATMLELSGLVTADEAMGAAQRVMAVETRLAAGHWDRVKSREADLINNPRTWAEIVEGAPGFPWDLWRESLDLPAGAGDTSRVGIPSYLTHFATARDEPGVDF